MSLPLWAHAIMEPDSDFRQLLNKSLLAIALCAVAVVVCYYFVDRQVAFFVQRHQVNKHFIFKWLTYPPPLFEDWSPVMLALLMVLRAWRPLRVPGRTLFVACVSMIVADLFRSSLGDLCGRYWPETWHNDNPSLIGTGTYGFHPFILSATPFTPGDDIGSFPSGHAARIAGFVGVAWIAMPRGRMLYALISLPMLIGLVAMNYHFVGDVIAGTVLGGIVAVYAATLAYLRPAGENNGAKV